MWSLTGSSTHNHHGSPTDPWTWVNERKNISIRHSFQQPFAVVFNSWWEVAFSGEKQNNNKIKKTLWCLSEYLMNCNPFFVNVIIQVICNTIIKWSGMCLKMSCEVVWGFSLNFFPFYFDIYLYMIFIFYGFLFISLQIFCFTCTWWASLQI